MKATGRPTVRSIAQQAGVSRATVSRVLNNQPNVSARVRARVQRIIEETGYRSDLEAADAPIKIGIIVPFWYDEYFTRQTMLGIEKARKFLRPQEVELIICRMNSRSDEEYIKRCEDLARQGVQAIALNASDNYLINAEIESLSNQGIKVATYNSDLTDSSRIFHVGQDIVKSGRIAAGLMSRSVGAQDKVLVVAGNLEFYGNKMRVDGYLQRMRELGYPPSSYKLVESFEDEHLTFQLVTDALKMPNLRGIYMASESVKGCVDALKGHNAPITIICNDLTPIARRQLQLGRIDFVIEQDFPNQIYEELIILSQLLLYHRPIRRTIRYVNTSIITKEAL